MEELPQELLEHDERNKGPLRLIAGLFLLLLVVMWMVPASTVPLNPEPTKRLTMEEAVSGLELKDIQNASLINSKMDYAFRVDSRNSQLKIVADRIASAGCDSSQICQAKSLFYFVRDELNYVNDPMAYEYVKSPVGSLLSTAGDCDDASVLLASMLGAIGIKSRFVFVPGHVYVEAWIPSAVNRDKQPSGWVVLDGTCSYCKFGELALDYVDLDKAYVEVH